MKIFLSWSGERSKYLAECFKEWLPYVLQYVDPYMSSKDINLGERWSTNITDNLKSHDFGLVFVTAENINASWINFEAGALSKSLQSRLVPIIFDADITILDNGPLKQFQSQKSLDKDSVLDLVKEIHSSLEEKIQISDNIIDSTFEKWWPDLDEKISRAPKYKSDSDNDKTTPSDGELLREIYNKISRNEMSKRDCMFSEAFCRDMVIVNSFLKNFNMTFEVNKLINDSIDDKDFIMQKRRFASIVQKMNRMTRYVREHMEESD